MNPEFLITEEEKTYLDHREEDARSTENSLGWRDTRDLPREIQGIDDRIQYGENTIALLRLLGFRRHGGNVR